jgi:uncharacterized protein YneF (UPF0154 family)
MQKLIRFFDKIEDRVRAVLAHHPVVYAMIGSVGIILLWRGIWGLADEYGMSFWTSTIIGTVILLLTGLFVSFFVGEQIIISGINEEHRVDEKTEEEIRFQSVSRIQMQWKLEGMLKELDRKIDRLEEKLETKPKIEVVIPKHPLHHHQGDKKI